MVVALAQFLELLLCDVEFPSSIEVDRVDEEVRMDMVAVCVGTDQNLIALIILGQLQRGQVCGDRIDRFVFREALHHVVEHDAVRFVVEPLRGHEICVDRFRLTVDTCDQSLTIELCFLILHGVAHHSAHTAAGLSTLVVGKVDDCHSSPTLSFQDHPNRVAEFRERLKHTVQVDYCNSSHMCQGDELI